MADHPTPRIPDMLLNDGTTIPQLGFGVWQVPNDEVGAAVTEALNAGYRAIDTAQGYDNEEGVGRALRESGVPRGDVYVTSKLRTKLLGYDEAQRGIEQSLDALGLDQLDLFLIHWPCPALDRYADAWRGLVQARANGLVKSIGVSNFLPGHIDRIVDETGVLPAINQLETHPHFQQRDVRDYHQRMTIQLESYSPLGSGADLDDPDLRRIAEKHGKSVAQVILRWHIEQRLVAIPKSVTPERIRENLDVFDFSLDAEDQKLIDALDDPVGGRTGSDPARFNDLY